MSGPVAVLRITRVEKDEEMVRVDRKVDVDGGVERPRERDAESVQLAGW